MVDIFADVGFGISDYLGGTKSRSEIGDVLKCTRVSG